MISIDFHCVPLRFDCHCDSLLSNRFEAMQLMIELAIAIKHRVLILAVQLSGLLRVCTVPLGSQRL